MKRLKIANDNASQILRKYYDLDKESKEISETYERSLIKIFIYNIGSYIKKSNFMLFITTNLLIRIFKFVYGKLILL